jgi:hypothetical protein
VERDEVVRFGSKAEAHPTRQLGLWIGAAQVDANGLFGARRGMFGIRSH